MKLHHTLSLILFFILLSTQLYSKVIYVKTNIIGGNNDGSSWQDSYIDFQDAITEAVYGDSIWVAQGTYYPTFDTNQDISFELKNGVKWFGGFQGIESEFSERDFSIYQTILSGDIGILSDSTDNSYHVIYSVNSDTTTVLDGFFISRGHGVDTTSNNSSPNNYGGGLFIEPIISNPTAYLKILNCTFENNNAKCGGGISLGKGYTTFNINPYIKNCSFINNKTVLQGGSGGALSVIGGSNNEETIYIRNCLFEGNQSFFNGGAIYLSETTSEFKFIDCDFIGNSTYGIDGQGNPNGSGGSISYYVNFFNNLSRLDFLDCKFFNWFSPTGRAISVLATNVYAGEILELKIKNTLFKDDSSYLNFNNESLSRIIDYLLVNKWLHLKIQTLKRMEY